MKRLILASTSKYRKALLSQLGIPFESMDPKVDEAPYKKLGLKPQDLALKLSLVKAEALAGIHPDAVVIGSDQVCILGDDTLSKPGSFEKAFEQIKRMQGKEHFLFTAVSICHGEEVVQFFNKTMLHMRSLNDKEIENYLKTDEPYDCAGSYKLETHGIRLFEKIEMTDHTSIIGLPLIQLNNELIKLGFSL